MIAILELETTAPQRLKEAFDALGADSRTVNSVEALNSASKIVLPPGGSLSHIVGSLRDRGLVGPLLRALEDGRPVLAISVGMHLLMDVSYEDGQHAGLGAIHGKAARLEFGQHPAAKHFVLPHRGWNQVTWSDGCPLLAGLQSGEYFYFDHSYHAEPLEERAIAARCNHGIDFAAVLWQQRVFGVQFLPERSEQAGLTVLTNFVAM